MGTKLRLLKYKLQRFWIDYRLQITLLGIKLRKNLVPLVSLKEFAKEKPYLIATFLIVLSLALMPYVSRISSLPSLINLDLQYGSNFLYDTNNDGTETIDGVVDLSISDTSIDGSLNTSNIATRWEIASLENNISTIICHGSEIVCNSIELVPSSRNWSDTLYLYYAKDGATTNNLVSAQIIYAEYNESSQTYSNIITSDTSTLKVSFIEPINSSVPENLSVTECSLPNISLETGDTSNLNLDDYCRYGDETLNYSIEQDSDISLVLNNQILTISSGNFTGNKTMELMVQNSINITRFQFSVGIYQKNSQAFLCSQIPNITIIKNGYYLLNLSNYCNYNNAIYSYYSIPNINISINESRAMLEPSKNFTGQLFTFFIANSSGQIFTTNTFKIDVVDQVLENLTPTIIMKKRDFTSNENISFEFEFLDEKELRRQNKWKDEYNSNQKSKGEIQKKKWESGKEKVEFRMSNHETNLDPDLYVEEEREGKLKVTIPANKREFKAGKYRIVVDLTRDCQVIPPEVDFTWGVLTININKSIYLQGDDSLISLGILDDMGKTICDADVTLKITDPSGNERAFTTSQGSVQKNPECKKLGFTALPDYYATYKIRNAGKYSINLTAKTATGTKQIVDSFEAKNNVDFDVARQGPTRIYPPIPYTM